MGAPLVRKYQRRVFSHHPGGWLMSYEAVQWALYDAPIPLTSAGKPDAAARLVLIARAERADKGGRNTYAGPADLIKSTGYDERTIQRADRRLEEAGLLVRDGFSHLGTVKWRLAVELKQSDDDRAFAEARIEHRRKLTAERVRRHRERQKGGEVESEIGESIEGDVSTKIGVTHSEALRNAPGERYVTHSDDVCNARSAPQTTNEPPVEPPVGTTPGGTLPPDPLRPHSPSARGIGLEGSLAISLTPAQDQQSESLPREAAPIVELFPGVLGEAPYRSLSPWHRRRDAVQDEIAAAMDRQAARRAEHQARLASGETT